MTDWKMIRAEYIEGGESITTLAKRHGVNPNTARYHFRREQWSEMRREARRRADEMLIETAAEQRAKMAVLLYEAGEKIAEALLAILDQHKAGGYTSMTETNQDMTVVFDLLDVVNVLAKLARTFGLDADSELNRQRIELMRRAPGINSDKSDRPVIIEIRPDRDAN